jgi:hypothetical protein
VRVSTRKVGDMPDIITDADVRIQIEQYLAAGSGPADFDVEAILADTMEIIRDRNLTGIDGVDAEVFARIVQRHDISAPSVPAAAADRSRTQSLLRDIYAAAEFVTSLALPATTQAVLSTHVQLPTRDELNAMAGRFGLPAPENAGHYDGAQFSVHVPGSVAYSTVLFYWVNK